MNSPILRERKNFSSVLLLSLVILSLHYNLFPSTIECNDVYVDLEQCFELTFEIHNEDNITSLIITFSFDPGKMQIGCNKKFNPDPPDIYIFDSNTSTTDTELPIVLNNLLQQQGFKFKLVIYPEGIYTVTIWGGKNAISNGTLFSVPAKLLSSAQRGDMLPIILHSEWNPAMIERNSGENENKASLYSSFANEQALPIYPTLIDGMIYVEAYPEEAESPEGTEEGEGESTEGAGEGNVSIEGENPSEEEHSPVCGCRNKKHYVQKGDLLMICTFLLLLSGIHKKEY